MSADDASSKSTRNVIDDLRGATRLAVEATRAVTEVVEAMHVGIAAGPDALGRPFEGATRLLTAPVYRTIRGITRLVGVGVDGALARLATVLAPALDGRGPDREALRAAINGVLGDYLAATDNPLAIEMCLRHAGRPLALDREALARLSVGGELVVLVHGSCMYDLQWLRNGHDHGAALARDLGYTPVYLHYNSGLHVSTNGRAFATLLESLVTAWPVPLERITIVAHSMGGLVARSACHYGALAGHGWRARLGELVCLGTPHHGAPLERGGNGLEVLLGITRYSAPLARLARLRSAGVTDLRHGNLLDEHWSGGDRFAATGDRRGSASLPDGVSCYAIAADRARVGEPTSGDGLVPIDSALGRHADPALQLAFPAAHQRVVHGIDHVALLDDAEVYATLLGWLALSVER